MEKSKNPLIEKLIRMGGLSNVAGGIFVALSYLLHPPVASPEVVSSGLWLAVHAGFMISLLAGIFALFAFMAAYLRNNGGLPGVIGCCMAISSLVFIFGLDYSEVFVFPTLAIEFPEVVEKYGDGTTMPSVAFAFPASGMLFLIGYIVVGQQMRKKACISSGSAYLLICGTLVFGIGLSGLVPMIILRLGAVLFGLGLIWSGLSLYALCRARLPLPG